MKWLGSTVAMHRIANPRTPVRFRPQPPFSFCGTIVLLLWVFCYYESAINAKKYRKKLLAKLTKLIIIAPTSDTDTTRRQASVL